MSAEACDRLHELHADLVEIRELNGEDHPAYLAERLDLNVEIEKALVQRRNPLWLATRERRG